MNWYKSAQVESRFSIGYPPILSGLASEAMKYDTFEDFKQAFQREIKHGMYWHVTEDPNFQINSLKGPRDMSSLAIGNPITEGALMITSHLEYWIAEYDDTRAYAAQIDMSEVPSNQYQQVNRGFGNEFFVQDSSLAKVIRILPLKVARQVNTYHHNLLPQNSQELLDFYNVANGINTDIIPEQRENNENELV